MKSKKELDKIAEDAATVFFDEVIKKCPEIKRATVNASDLEIFDEACKKIVHLWYNYYSKKEPIKQDPTDFKQKLEKFINNTWKEDQEIAFIELIEEFWKTRKNAPDFQWIAYLKNLWEKNQHKMFTRISGAFRDQLFDLIGKK